MDKSSPAGILFFILIIAFFKLHLKHDSACGNNMGASLSQRALDSAAQAFKNITPTTVKWETTSGTQSTFVKLNGSTSKESVCLSFKSSIFLVDMH